MKALAEVLPGDPARKSLLVNDPRMVSVWREPGRVPLGPEVIDRLEDLERVTTWDISDMGVSFNDQACAGLVAFTVIEFSQVRIDRETRSITVKVPMMTYATLWPPHLNGDPGGAHRKAAQAGLAAENANELRLWMKPNSWRDGVT